MDSEFQKPGTLPRPGILGRSLRLGFAGLLALVLADFLEHYNPAAVPPKLTLLLMLLGCTYGVGEMSKLLGGDKWSVRALLAYVALGLGALAADWFLYQQLWAPPLGWYFYVLVTLLLGLLILSFVVQAVFATPG